MSRSGSRCQSLVMVVSLLVLVGLACGVSGGSSSDDSDSAVDDLSELEPQADADQEESLSDEEFAETILDEIEGYIEEVMTGLFLLSTPFSTSDIEALDVLFSKLDGYASESEIAAMRQHASMLYSDILFIAGDPTGDLYTCLNDEFVADPVSYSDIKLLLGGTMPDGNVGISNLSAFVADVMGISAEDYVLDNSKHHLMRLSFFDSASPGLDETAQWQYEANGESFSINLKNVPLNGAEEFLTFNGAPVDGEWVSEPTHLQSYFNDGIWLMRFDAKMLSGDTSFYFTSNNFDTNNPNGPNTDCQYDQSLFDEAGKPVLNIGLFQLALEERRAQLLDITLENMELPGEIRIEVPATFVSEDGFDIDELREIDEDFEALNLPGMPGELSSELTDAQLEVSNNYLDNVLLKNMLTAHGFIVDPENDVTTCSGVPAPGAEPLIDIGRVAVGTTMDSSILVVSMEFLNARWDIGLEEFLTEAGFNMGAGLEIDNPILDDVPGLLLGNQFVYSYFQDGSRFDLRGEYLDGEWDTTVVEPETEVPGTDEVFFLVENRTMTIFIPGMYLSNGAKIYVSTDNTGSGGDCFTDSVDTNIEILREGDDFADPQDYRFTVGFRF